MNINGILNIKSSNIADFKPKSNNNIAKEDLNFGQNQNVQTLNYGYVNPNIPLNYTKLGVQKTPFGDDIHLFKLSNGQKVAIMKKKGTTVVQTFIKTGSINEQDSQRGISHFIEHNLFNGSEGIEAGGFFNEVRKMGADNNASTGLNVTDYYISSNLLNESDLENQRKVSFEQGKALADKNGMLFFETSVLFFLHGLH